VGPVGQTVAVIDGGGAIDGAAELTVLGRDVVRARQSRPVLGRRGEGLADLVVVVPVQGRGGAGHSLGGLRLRPPALAAARAGGLLVQCRGAPHVGPVGQTVAVIDGGGAIDGAAELTVLGRDVVRARQSRPVLGRRGEGLADLVVVVPVQGRGGAGHALGGLRLRLPALAAARAGGLLVQCRGAPHVGPVGQTVAVIDGGGAIDGAAELTVLGRDVVRARQSRPVLGRRGEGLADLVVVVPVQGRGGAGHALGGLRLRLPALAAARAGGLLVQCRGAPHVGPVGQTVAVIDGGGAIDGAAELTVLGRDVVRARQSRPVLGRRGEGLADLVVVVPVQGRGGAGHALGGLRLRLPALAAARAGGLLVQCRGAPHVGPVGQTVAVIDGGGAIDGAAELTVLGRDVVRARQSRPVLGR